jgi:tRNA pseudouridine55 synthase
MIPRTVTLEKKRGETPLEVIERWRIENPEYIETRTSYAGRLDPMAEGKLLVLMGDECKRQKEYRDLDKEYEVEVLLDVKTDTADVLGIPDYRAIETKTTKEEVRVALKKVIGTHSVPYPAFSSKTVAGKPLFLYALEGTLDTVEIPVHEETIYGITGLTLSSLSKDALATRIEEALAIVPCSDEPSKVLGADFRQHVIRPGWRVLFSHIPERTFTIVRMRVICGSGAYMRTLAERIASELGTCAVALSINRTKIGKYKKFGPLSFWLKKF